VVSHGLDAAAHDAGGGHGFGKALQVAGSGLLRAPALVHLGDDVVEPAVQHLLRDLISRAFEKRCQSFCTVILYTLRTSKH